MVVTLQSTKSMKKINTLLLEKGSTKEWTDGWIRRIVTSAGCWISAPMDPHQWTCRNWTEELPPSQWDAAVQERQLAEGTKHFLHSLGKSGKTRTRYDVRIETDHIFRRTLKLSQPKIDWRCCWEIWTYLWARKAFRIIANHALPLDLNSYYVWVGMGGTENPQVIKALMDLFKARNESHRLLSWHPQDCSSSSAGFDLSLIFRIPIEGQTLWGMRHK